MRALFERIRHFKYADMFHPFPYRSLPANADVFPAVASLRRSEATAGNTSAFAGHTDPPYIHFVGPLREKLHEVLRSITSPEMNMFHNFLCCRNRYASLLGTRMKNIYRALFVAPYKFFMRLPRRFRKVELDSLSVLLSCNDHCDKNVARHADFRACYARHRLFTSEIWLRMEITNFSLEEEVPFVRV